MIFIRLIFSFCTVHLVTRGTLHMCIVLLERKFVLIDQNFTGRMQSHEQVRKETSGRHRRFPPLFLSIYLSLSLFICLSIYLVLHPVDISDGNFFPSRKKHAAVYLKRQGFIVHSRGNDTLSNNHLALIYLGVAPSLDVTSTTLTEFLANRHELERKISTSMLGKFSIL